MSDVLIEENAMRNSPQNDIFDFLDVLKNINEMSPESFYSRLRGTFVRDKTQRSVRKVIKKNKWLLSK